MSAVLHAFRFDGNQIKDVNGFADLHQLRDGEVKSYTVRYTNASGVVKKIEYEIRFHNGCYDANRTDGFFRKLANCLLPWFRSTVSARLSTHFNTEFAIVSSKDDVLMSMGFKDTMIRRKIMNRM